MPRKRGVSGFWLDIKALENDRTHLVAALGAKEGMLAFGAWVRMFTWQYHSAAPIKDAAHLSRLTNLHIHKARTLWELLPQLLPRSLIRSPYGLLCQRTMGTLDKIEENQNNTGEQLDTHTRGGPDPDPDLPSYSSSSSPPYVGEEEKEIEGSSTKPAEQTVVDFPKPKVKNCPTKEILQLYHKILVPPFQQVRRMNPTRESHIRARWQQDLKDLDRWEAYFKFVKKSDWLMGRAVGRDGSPFRNRNIDYLVKLNSFTQIVERKYHGQ